MGNSYENLTPNLQAAYRANKKRHLEARKVRKYRMKTKVDLDVSCFYVDSYKENQQVCEICGRKNYIRGKEAQLCVDHDHNTNKFRGLLCSCCNRNLGWYEQNSLSINKYLDKAS